MARLNINRIMKTLKKDKERQEQAKLVKPAPSPKEENMTGIVPDEHCDMTAADLEEFLTEFFHVFRGAKSRYDAAVIAEEAPNLAIQDYLHQIELAPENLPPATTVIQDLHELRKSRRDLKKELEVTELFHLWAVENKTALDKLQQTLGKIRKVITRQPNDLYFYKTDVVGEKSKILQIKEEESSNEN